MQIRGFLASLDTSAVCIATAEELPKKGSQTLARISSAPSRGTDAFHFNLLIIG
jgi:hypothetical protein